MKKFKQLMTGTMATAMVITTLFPSTALAADVHDEVAESNVVESVAETTSDIADKVSDVVDEIPTYTVPETEENETDEESVDVVVHEDTTEMSEVVSTPAETHTRLLLMSEDELTEFYGATNVEYCDGVYVLTYEDTTTCMKAFSSFTAANRNVEYDDVVETFDQDVESVSNVDDTIESIEETNVLSDETTTEEVVEDVTTNIDNIDVTKQRLIKVALIDTGVDTTNEILQNHLADGYDTSNMSDPNGHGTLMAEIIASNTNENVKIVPYQTFDENGKSTVGATYYALLKAINEQVDVISLSISGYGTSNLLTSAIAKAKEAGIYVVVAAGNDSDNADNYMPGNVTDAITVSATDVDENGNKIFADYSNYGSCVDYSAYGTIVKDNGTEDTSDDEVYTGTSISSAKVSSYLATMLQYIKNDATTENDEVIDALNTTLEDLGDAGRDDYFGEGYLSKEGIDTFISDKTPIQEEVQEPVTDEDTASTDEDTNSTGEEITTEEETTTEEEYANEEGDIDLEEESIEEEESIDEEDAEQELDTCITRNASAQLAFLATATDIQSQDVKLILDQTLDCIAGFSITIPAGRTYKIFNQTNNSYAINNIYFYVQGELQIFTQGGGNINIVGSSGSSYDVATITVQSGGKALIRKDGGNGSIFVKGGTNGVAVWSGGTLESSQGLVCSENYGNGLFVGSGGSADVSNATFRDNGHCGKSGDYIVFPDGHNSYETYAFSGISNHGTLTASSCNIHGNNRNGVNAAGGTSTTLNGCSIHENGTNGAKIEGTASVSSCSVYSNSSNGIISNSSANVTITNGEVYSNGDDGIQNGDSGTTSTMTITGTTGTTVRNNGANGIYNHSNCTLTIDSGSFYDNNTRQLLNESSTGLFNFGIIINGGSFSSSISDGIKNASGGNLCIQGRDTAISAPSEKTAIYNESGSVYLQGSASLSGSGIGLNNSGSAYVGQSDSQVSASISTTGIAIKNSGSLCVNTDKSINSSSNSISNSGSATIYNGSKVK